MEVSSPNFKNGEIIPKKFTADGENVNPTIIVEQISPKVKSLVLIVEDPDAKRVCGHTWIHWVVFNIPVKGSKLVINENSLPGLAGESTYLKREYGGPNPPKGNGVHNYFFKIFALDKIINLEDMAPLKKIEKEMQDHIVEKTEFFGKYWRD